MLGKNTFISYLLDHKWTISGRLSALLPALRGYGMFTTSSTGPRRPSRIVNQRSLLYPGLLRPSQDPLLMCTPACSARSARYVSTTDGVAMLSTSTTALSPHMNGASVRGRSDGVGEEEGRDAQRRAHQSAEGRMLFGSKTVVLEEESEMRQKGFGSGRARRWHTNLEPTTPTPMMATETVLEATCNQKTRVRKSGCKVPG